MSSFHDFLNDEPVKWRNCTFTGNGEGFRIQEASFKEAPPGSVLHGGLSVARVACIMPGDSFAISTGYNANPEAMTVTGVGPHIREKTREKP